MSLFPVPILPQSATQRTLAHCRCCIQDPAADYQLQCPQACLDSQRGKAGTTC